MPEKEIRRGVLPNGKLIDALRKRKGWTLEDFAEGTSFTSRTVQRAIAGLPIDIPKLNAIAVRLGTTFESLLLLPDTETIAQKPAMSKHGTASVMIQEEADGSFLVKFHVELPLPAGPPELSPQLLAIKSFLQTIFPGAKVVSVVAVGTGTAITLSMTSAPLLAQGAERISKAMLKVAKNKKTVLIMIGNAPSFQRKNWDTIIQAVQTFGDTLQFDIAIDPYSKPCARDDSNYMSNLRKCRDAGIRVLGFHQLGSETGAEIVRSKFELFEEIDVWDIFYPRLISGFLISGFPEATAENFPFVDPVLAYARDWIRRYGAVDTDHAADGLARQLNPVNERRAGIVGSLLPSAVPAGNWFANGRVDSLIFSVNDTRIPEFQLPDWACNHAYSRRLGMSADSVTSENMVCVIRRLKTCSTFCLTDRSAVPPSYIPWDKLPSPEFWDLYLKTLVEE